MGSHRRPSRLFRMRGRPCRKSGALSPAGLPLAKKNQFRRAGTASKASQFPRLHSKASRMTASCRLYLITPPEIADLAGFIESLKAALAGGDVACLQLRLKTAAGVSASDEDRKSGGEGKRVDLGG